jgi:hypothetical protein
VLAVERVLVLGLAGMENRLKAEEALGRYGATGGAQPDRGRRTGDGGEAVPLQ